MDKHQIFFIVFSLLSFGLGYLTCRVNYFFSSVKTSVVLVRLAQVVSLSLLATGSENYFASRTYRIQNMRKAEVPEKQIKEFDKLFMKASSRLPPQQRLDYRELSSALGLTFTDRSAAAMRWCFGDIFHGTLEDAEEDLLEAEESLDTQKVTGEQEGVIQPLPSSSLKRHRSRAPLPLLEQHLIRERAANFSPLTQ